MQTKYLPTLYPTKTNVPVTNQNESFWDYIALAFSISFSFVIANSLVYAHFNSWVLLGFTLGYIGLVISYVRSHHLAITVEAKFWLLLILMASINNLVFPNNYLSDLQLFFIFTVSVYWGATMMKGLLLNKTSNYLILDLVNIFILVPLLNLKIVKRFMVYHISKQKVHSTSFIQIGIGLLISLPLILFVLPLLIKADVSSTLLTFFETLPTYFKISENGLLSLALTLVIFLLMFAFLLGYSKRSHLTDIKEDYFETNKDNFKILPMSSALTAWSIILGLYSFYILAQVSYLFSAFSGNLPESSNLIYSSYARQGFFELCMIASINLLLILLTEILTRKKISIMGYFYVIISIITTLLSITALSKLVLYISVYGLTPSRILSTAFVVYLGLVWIGIAIRQFKSFSIIRFSLISGALIVLLLCILQIDTLSSSYNSWLNMI